jgi:integrase/recombinase XerD
MSEQIGTPMKDPTRYLNYPDLIRLENSTKELRDKVIISMMWRCGLRVNELINIKKKDIYIDDVDRQNSIVVVTGKGNRLGRVPIDEELIGILVEYIQPFSNEDFIFPSWSKQGHITKQWVRKLLIKIGNDARIVTDVGGHPLHPHTLRHSFAIFLVHMGVPIEKIQQLLRHTSLSSTTYYLQFSKEELSKDYHEAFRKMREKK